MSTRAFLSATIFVIFLGACTDPSTPEQSGAGAYSDSADHMVGTAGTNSDDPPVGTAIHWRNPNVDAIYNGPGGG